jgi:mono/diheme cytochrome c family protein
VLVKSFFIDGAPVESRLLVQDDEGWTGYGYAWNADGTEAEYVEEHREQDLAGGGRWIFPDSRECRACHTRAAGWSLGLETAQLAGAVQGLVDRGWLPESPSGAPLPRPDDDQVSVAERARAYLHVNCSSCHRPEAPGGRAQLDLLYDTPLADTGLCNALPRAGDLGVSQARLLEPGDPSRSILSARIRAGGSAHMPPLATALVDEAGATLIDAWIDALTACL